jgi:hypothetical protein
MDGEIYVGKYKFGVECIDFETDFDNENAFHRKTNVWITEIPMAIILSCGVELSAMEKSHSYYLTFESINDMTTWRLYSRSIIAANFETCSYKSKNQENLQLFNKVTFEPNWGAFISGEVYDD